MYSNGRSPRHFVNVRNIGNIGNIQGPAYADRSEGDKGDIITPPPSKKKRKNGLNVLMDLGLVLIDLGWFKIYFDEFGMFFDGFGRIFMDLD